MLLTEENSSTFEDEASMAETSPQKKVKNFSLYLRFHKRFNANREKAIAEVKSLNNKINNVRIPRQKAAKFCLVDFRTKKDCDDAIKELKTIKLNGRSIVIKAPVTDDPNKIALKMKKNIIQQQSKNSLNNLLRNIQHTLTHQPLESVTNRIIVENIPRKVKETVVRDLFPDAMEFRLIVPKSDKNSLAHFTLPSPKDALHATRKKITLNGSVLNVGFQKDQQEVELEDHKVEGKSSGVPLVLQYIKINC